MLKSKEIIIGVTGGIAAYKAADLVSCLRQQGMGVTVVMTESAARFVTPLTFQALSGNRVYTRMFDDEASYDYAHISLADRVDVVLIAPATANIIAKLAHGIADDLLSTFILAVRVPVLIAPAMNVNMYENPIVQENIKKLKKAGRVIIEPDSGYLACGQQGRGRLATREKIVKAIQSALKNKRKKR